MILAASPKKSMIFLKHMAETSIGYTTCQSTEEKLDMLYFMVNLYLKNV